MNEGPKKARLGARLLQASLLLLVFGVGVWVGKPASGRKTPPRHKGYISRDDRAVESDLAACRQTLAARSEARAAASAAVAAAERFKQDAPDVAAQIEALEDKLEGCRTRDIVGKADICSSHDRYSIVLSALVYGAESCVDPIGIGDFMVKNYDQCPEFDNVPYDWTPDDYDLTEEERRRVTNAAYDHHRFGKEQLAGLAKFVISACVKKKGESHE